MGALRAATCTDKRIVQQAFRQTPDIVRVGGGEQQVLALLRQQLDDAANIRDEAHIQHAIGFVEHQHLNLGKIHAALLREIQQPARSGDQNIATVAQGGDLRIDADAAEHLIGPQRHVFPIVARALRHLCGEFASGREQQRPRRALVALRLIRRETLQNGQHEAGRFAGAGLRSRENIAAREDGRDRLKLNGGRRVVALVGDSTQQFGQ